MPATKTTMHTAPPPPPPPNPTNTFFVSIYISSLWLYFWREKEEAEETEKSIGWWCIRACVFLGVYVYVRERERVSERERDKS